MRKRRYAAAVWCLTICLLAGVTYGSAADLIRETFETFSMDKLPAGWGTAVSGGAKISVVDRPGEPGRKCLLFQNATDSKLSFEPDLEIYLPMKGGIRLSFDVLLPDGNADFTVQPRRDPAPNAPAIIGPFMEIGKNGKIAGICNDNRVDFGAVTPGSWMHFEIVMRPAGSGDPGWDLSVTADGKTRTYTKLAYKNQVGIPDLLNRLVFHGTNRNNAGVYFDNLIVETVPEVKLSSPSGPGEPPAENLCVAVAGATIRTDSYIASFKDMAVVMKNPADYSLKSINDGNLKTYWHSGRRKFVMEAAFPAPVTVAQSYWFHAAIAPGTLDERGLQDYDIETSPDGRRWEPAASVRGYLGGYKHDTFTPRPARYVRMKNYQVQGFLLPVLCEWELYARPRPAYAAETSWRPEKTPTREVAGDLVLTVTADKMLYRPGETAAVSVTVENHQGRDASADIALFLRRGVEERSKIASWTVALKGGTARSLSHRIKNLRQEYGYHVTAILTEKGKPGRQSDCVFEMADNWAKIARWNGDTGFDKLVPDFPDEEITNVHMPMLRKLYLNCMELFGQHVMFCRHYTDKDEWNSPYPYHYNHGISARTTKLWTGQGDKNGIRVVTYSETGALDPRLNIPVVHPDWVVYGPLSFPDPTKHLYAMWLYFHNMSGAFPAGKPIVAPDLHFFNAGDINAMTDYLARDFGQAVKRFGWTGCFFDSISWALEDSAFGHNREGKPLNTVSSDEIGGRFLRTLKQEVYKASGVRFVPVANFGLPEGVSPWHEVEPDLENYRKTRAIYRKTLAELGIFCLEQHPLPHILTEKDPAGQFIYPQTIEDTVRALRLVREANDVNVPVMLLPTQYVWGLSQTPLDTNLLYASSFASGVLLYTARGTMPRSLLTEPLENLPVFAAEANYNKFAARYGEYLFDPSIRWLPKGRVECRAPANVWWRDLVSFRDRPDGDTDIYVHLINRPSVPLTWGKKMEPPAVLTDIPVRFGVPEGKKLKGVWCLSPNGDHDPVPLKPVPDGNSATVTVPRLEYWTMLVCRCSPAASGI